MFKRSASFSVSVITLLTTSYAFADAAAEAPPALKPGLIHSPTGYLVYDYQALLGTMVAFLALLATFLIAERNRKQDWAKFEAAQENERNIKRHQKLAFYAILREDLTLLKEDIEDQVKIFKDLCSEVSDADFSSHLTPAQIDRRMTSSRPRVGTALVEDWKITEFLSDPNIAQYLERVNKYLRSLEESIDWCKESIVEMQRSQTFDDVDDVKNYVESRKLRLFAAVEQLRSSLAAA